MGLGLNALASPTGLTVTSYADLVRFSVQGEVKEFQIQVISLAGEKVFDSGPVTSSALDWKVGNSNGRSIANGVYLYSVIVDGKRHMGKLAIVRGQGSAAPALLTTIPTVGDIAKRTGPSSFFDGSGNLIMENDQICLGGNCTAAGRIYDQVVNSRTVFHGLGNKVSYVSEDGSKILMQMQTLVLNGRDTALIAGGISGTKNVAFLGDTGGNGDVLLNYAGTGAVGIGTNAPDAKLHVDGGTGCTLSTTTGYIITNDNSSTNLCLDNTVIQARNNGSASLLGLNPNGGTIIMSASGGDEVGIGTNAPSNASKLHVVTDEVAPPFSTGNAIYAHHAGTVPGSETTGVLARVDSDSGYGVLASAWSTTGVNYGVYGSTLSPDGFGVYSHGRLHARREISDASFYTNHVATLENTSTGTSADVLALKMNMTGNPGAAANFITFFDGDSDTASLGAIQGNGAGGVEFGGTGADFAEWLPRMKVDEAIEPGEIVGIFGGKVAKTTKAAQSVQVVSTGPIVVGNAPAEDKEDLYERIAFLGQVPVKVRGVVNAGDYIVPSGLNDGTGIAVSPNTLKPEHYNQIVGRAWESSSELGVKLINTVVGLPNSALSELLKSKKQQIESLQARLEKLEKEFGKLQASFRK
jgi:hypothetical protein